MRGRSRAAAGVACALGAIALLSSTAVPSLLLRDEAVPGEGAPPATASPRAGGAGEAPPADDSLPGPAPAPDLRPAGDDPLSLHLAASIYPPSSRPLSAEQVDLLEPGRRHEIARALPGDGTASYLLTADRYFVVGDEPIAFLLEVVRGGHRLAPEAVRAAVRTLGPGAASAPVTFRADEGLLVAPFSPAGSALAEDTGVLELTVELVVEGRPVRDRLRFHYTAPADLPARFTGAFADAIEHGSLVIRPGVEVKRAGYYTIDCNLYDAAGVPLAWTRFKGALSPEAGAPELRFFGKVLVDAGRPGPYRIGELRGTLHLPGGEIATVPVFTGSFETGAYRASDFSPEEYDSPHKRAKTEFLRAQLGGPHALMQGTR